MGKAAVNKIDISSQDRSKENSFSEVKAQDAIGPVSNKTDNNTDDDSGISIGGTVTSNINVWTVMTTGDQGLKDAIYSFINTTKDGINVAPDTVHGREKKMVFNFFGSVGKSIMPGEIGEFEVVFSYPPSGTGNGNDGTAEA